MTEGKWRDTLRIIDANLNRAGEGLRVLEELARLILDDADVSAQLKALRHSLVRTSPGFQQALVRARDAAGDVGREATVEGEGAPGDLQAVLVANARRVQESLRVLEELAKLPGIAGEIDAAKIGQARFSVYALQQNMMLKLQNRERARE